MAGLTTAARPLIAALAVAGLGASGCSFDNGGLPPTDGRAVDAAIDGTPDALDAAIDAALPDGDGDGVPDATDNCVAIDNPDQGDEDTDGLGDACDNCPHVKNADQANVGETTVGEQADGAGDACDPFPSDPGNDIVFFDGFASRAAAWTRVSGTDSWTASGGKLHQPISQAQTRVIQYTGQSFDRVVIDTRFTITDLPPATGPTDTNRSLGVLASFMPGGNYGVGYLCLASDNPTSPSLASTITLFEYQGNTFDAHGSSRALGTELVADSAFTMRVYSDGADDHRSCSVNNAALPSATTTSYDDNSVASGRIALRTSNLAADFDFVIAFSVE
jgi:hypothetical protein